jgi:hypothetical protein
MIGPVVIQLVALADGRSHPHAGAYVLGFTPHPKPHGTMDVTFDRAKAKQFEDAGAAHTYWRQQHGRRPDGLPNRPLCAWTIEVASADGLSLTDTLRPRH